LKDIVIVKSKSEGTASFMIGTTEFALQIGNLIDVKSELEKMQAELNHLEGFLKGVNSKLSNDNFVSHAPASVIENERKKQSDTLQKIATIKDSMLTLESNV
jgi:valyl-tRNA synthetase